MYVCMYVCMYVHINTHTQTRSCVYIVYVCTCPSTYACCLYTQVRCDDWKYERESYFLFERCGGFQKEIVEVCRDFSVVLVWGGCWVRRGFYSSCARNLGGAGWVLAKVSVRLWSLESTVRIGSYYWAASAF